MSPRTAPATSPDGQRTRPGGIVVRSRSPFRATPAAIDFGIFRSHLALVGIPAGTRVQLLSGDASDDADQEQGDGRHRPLVSVSLHVAHREPASPLSLLTDTGSPAQSLRWLDGKSLRVDRLPKSIGHLQRLWLFRRGTVQQFVQQDVFWHRCAQPRRCRHAVIG